MTVPHTHLDDEALSTILDSAPAGTAAPAELEGCSDCTERLRALSRARDAVAAPVTPLPQARVEAIVTAAIESGGAVTPLRRRVTTPAPRWLAAAAAAFALLLAVPALLDLAGSGGDEATGVKVASGGGAGSPGAAAISGDTAATGSAEAADESFASSSSPGDALAAAPSSVRSSFGELDDPAELVRRVVAVLSRGGDATAEPAVAERSAPPGPRCEDAARGVGGTRLGSMTLVGDVVWKGRPAEVLVFVLTEPAEGRERQAYVMSMDGCVLFADPQF